MGVHPSNRVLAGVAVAAPAADVLGRVLAPSLLATWPALIVALSPADPHLLLATGQSRLVLASIAFATRLGRAWAIFRTAEHLADRIGHGALRRLLLPRADRRWRHRTGIGAVLLLPGMVGAVVAARSRLRPRLYLGVASVSTALGLALTLTAAHLLERQLAMVQRALTTHAPEATVLVGAVLLFGLVVRWRGAVRPEPGSPRGLLRSRRSRGDGPRPP